MGDEEQDRARGKRAGTARRSPRAPGRKPLAEGNAADTRRDIRRHAVRLFNERGYESVTLDDIAVAAMVNRATVYYHFAGKEDVFLDSIGVVAAFVRAQIEAIVTQKELSVRERLSLLVRTRREFDGVPPVGDHDEIDENMIQAAMPHLSPGGQARLGEMMMGLHGLTGDLITEGITKGELPPLPPQVIDFAFWQLFPPDGYPPELGNRSEIEEGLLQLFFERLQQT